MKNVLIRTDCSVDIGIGHAMRCLALGTALRDAGVATTYIMADCLAEMADRFATEAFSIRVSSAKPGSVEDAKHTARVALDTSADLIVLDGYHFGASYHRDVGRASVLAVFDDPGTGADIVIAPTPPARPDLYDVSLPSARLLLGPDYLLLRPEFTRWANWRRQIAKRAQRIMVAIGGTDPLNMTVKTLEALDQLPGELEIIVATAVKDDRCAGLSGVRMQAGNAVHDVRVEQGVSDMAALMAWADMGIVGGGTTLWEVAFMGLPSVALIVADNQAPGSAYFEQVGCGVAFDVRRWLDSDALTRTLSALIPSTRLREGYRNRGQTLVDGKGARRLVSALDAIVA